MQRKKLCYQFSSNEYTTSFLQPCTYQIYTLNIMVDDYNDLYTPNHEKKHFYNNTFTIEMQSNNKNILQAYSPIIKNLNINCPVHHKLTRKLLSVLFDDTLYHHDIKSIMKVFNKFKMHRVCYNSELHSYAPYTRTTKQHCTA